MNDSFFSLLISFFAFHLLAMEPDEKWLPKKKLSQSNQSKLSDDLRELAKQQKLAVTKVLVSPFQFLFQESEFSLKAISPDKKKIVSLTVPPLKNSWLEISSPSSNQVQKLCIGMLSQENLSFCDEESLIFCFINNKVIRRFDMEEGKECSELQKTEKLVKFNIFTHKSFPLLSSECADKVEELKERANAYQSKDNKIFVTGILDEEIKRKSIIGLPKSKKVIYAAPYINKVIIMEANSSSDSMRELNSKYNINTLAHYNEKLIAAGNEYGFIEIWDLEKNSNEPSIRIKQENDIILSLEFDPTGKYLAVGAQDRFSVWNLDSQSKCFDHFFEDKKNISSISWSQDSLIIKTKNCKVYRVNLEVLLNQKKDKF